MSTPASPAPHSVADANPDAYRPLVPARLCRNDAGVPYSPDYDDIYHTAAGALGQARHVFLAGNGLPRRWQQRESFTIVETGFGIGLNFLATWAAWRDDPAACRRLHFVSLEKHPFSAADLGELHAAHPELADLAAELRAQWPLLTPGVHRLHFAGSRVSLTLFFGDAQSLLPQLRLAADAFYLDGFAPAKNPDLWSPFVFRGLARCAAAGATLATWSVAAGVREGLQAVGFVSDKAPGFGGKRDMLQGQYRGPGVRRTVMPGKRILVIGAGFAGTSTAHRLAERGYQVTLLDQAEGPGCGASGNRVGVLRPLPSLDDNRLSRLTRSAFLYTRRHLLALSAAGLPVRWGASGVLHLARDKTHEATQRQVAETFAAPELFRYVDAAEASRLIGWPVSVGGWHFPGGGWGMPPSLCQANLQAHPAIEQRYGQRVEKLQAGADGWAAYAADGILLAEADQVVLANAADARRLGGCDWLPLRSARGQATLVPETATPPLDMVVCRLGYVTPALDGLRVCGASFLAGDEDPQPRLEEQQDNLAKLNFILPGFAKDLAAADLGSRVGFRPISPDRLPMLGPLPENTAPATGARLQTLPRRPGLWLASGFGARGFVWSAWAGEFLASQMAGDPLPLEGDLADALDPARFLLKPVKAARFNDRE